MSAQNEAREWFLDLLQQSPQADAAVGTALQHIDLPHRKQEAWRYADLTRLYQKIFKPAYGELPQVEFDSWIYPEDASYRLVLVNGQVHPGLSSLPQQAGVTLRELPLENDAENLGAYLSDGHEFSQDAFDLLNSAVGQRGFLLHVGANVQLDRPLEVVYLNQSGSENTLTATRCLILLEQGAEAKVVEHFSGGDDDAYFFNGLTRVELKDNARLTHHRLQGEGQQAYHLHRVFVGLQAYAHYQGLNIATGALWSRSDSVVNFNGEGGECHLKGLYSLRDGQYNDMHLDVRHLRPHCRSSEQFKGILAGKGRAVFDGRILIEQDAQKSDAHLSNKNLLLVDNAEIDTKPQLEIYADDVKASHGTTVGKIDPAQLFYCRARGIDEQQAVRMLSLGFAEQVLEGLDDEDLERAAEQLIEQVLA